MREEYTGHHAHTLAYLNKVYSIAVSVVVRNFFNDFLTVCCSFVVFQCILWGSVAGLSVCNV